MHGLSARGRTLVLAIVGLFTLRPAITQVSTGSIAGQVTDQSQAVIPAIKVTLTNEGTQSQRTVVTGSDGNYLFPLVAPGIYRIGVVAAGFKTYEASGLEVQVGQAVTHLIALEVGDTATRVEIVASAPVLDQRSAEIGQVIAQKEILELPLNGRNFLDLAKLVPGVTELGTTSQSNGLAINGQRANQIGFYFDGIDTRTETSGKPAFSPSIEAIQEFKIQQNNFLAEYGRNPAGVNLTLRPGTNDFHGTAFYFLRKTLSMHAASLPTGLTRCGATSLVVS